MDMIAPFFKYGMFGEAGSLFAAVLIGIAFGFVLERAGFGSAQKLAAQFYFTDLSVFKVMFTAIITAMLGVFWLSWIGFLDLSQVYVNPTFLLPQVTGGLIFGAGFVMGGYCPGTSCVAAVTGKKDGWVNLLGMFCGILIFGEAFPGLERFYNATPMGTITLPVFLHLPYGTVVCIITLLALGAFAGAEKIENNHRQSIPSTGETASSPMEDLNPGLAVQK